MRILMPCYRSSTYVVIVSLNLITTLSHSSDLWRTNPFCQKKGLRRNGLIAHPVFFGGKTLTIYYFLSHKF